jgi:taurine dioxygenase
MEQQVPVIRPSDSDDPAILRLSGTLGAAMTVVRMEPGDPALAERIRMAAIRHRVIALRDQFLGPEELLAFGAGLGRFMQTRAAPADERWPELLYISNPGKANALSENWHTDGTTSACPPSLSLLAAQEVPEAGGDTLFCDMGHAYQTLSPAYRKLLRGLRRRHLNTKLPASERIEA